MDIIAKWHKPTTQSHGKQALTLKERELAKMRTLKPDEAALWHLVGKTTKGLKGKEHLKLRQLENILVGQKLIPPTITSAKSTSSKDSHLLKQKYPAQAGSNPEAVNKHAKDLLIKQVKPLKTKGAKPKAITKAAPLKSNPDKPNNEPKKVSFKRVKKPPQIKKIIVKKEDIAKLGNSFATSKYKPPVADMGNERKVRRGQLEIDGRIDLHGMTQVVAQNALREFILNAFALNKRNLLIITGKGIELNDHRDEAFDMFAAPHRGVLRLKLRDWLNRPSVRHCISGISEANAKHGGSGAFYVRLKAK